LNAAMNGSAAAVSSASSGCFGGENGLFIPRDTQPDLDTSVLALAYFVGSIATVVGISILIGAFIDSIIAFSERFLMTTGSKIYARDVETHSWCYHSLDRCCHPCRACSNFAAGIPCLVMGPPCLGALLALLGDIMSIFGCVAGLPGIGTSLMYFIIAGGSIAGLATWRGVKCCYNHQGVPGYAKQEVVGDPVGAPSRSSE